MKKYIIKFSFIVLSMFLILSIFSGCTSENKNGKITVNVLDENNNQISTATVKIEGVGEKNAGPYVFEGLEAYKSYPVIVNGLDTKYQDFRYVTAEASEKGTIVVVKVTFAPTIQIVAGNKLSESSDNDGALASGDILIRVNDGKFDSTISKTDVTFANKPVGMDYTVLRNSDQEIKVTLTGKAKNNYKKDSISNMTITVKKEVVIGSKIDLTTGNVSIDFRDLDITLITDVPLVESIKNDGSLAAGTIKVQLNRGTFVGTLVKADIKINNLPAGMDYNLVQTNDKQLEINITGNATKNSSVDSITNLSITIPKAKIDGAAGDLTTQNLSITFNNPYPVLVTNAGTVLTEAAANDGSLVSGTIELTISNGEFDASTGKNDVTISNLPLGFDYTVSRNSATSLTITLTGKAYSHSKEYSLTNMMVIVNKSVVSNAVEDLRSPKISVNFMSPYPTLTVISDGNLLEAAENDGSISNAVIKIKVNDGTFDKTMTKADITLTNLPKGLDFSLTSVTNDEVSITITGKATSNAKIDSIQNLVVVIDKDRILGAIDNLRTKDIPVTFMDPMSIEIVSGSILDESVANDGSLSTGNIRIRIANGELADNITKKDILVENLPDGLSYDVVQNTNKEITVLLSGKAVKHALADSINNLDIVVSKEKIKGATSSLVSGKIAINFIAPYPTFEITGGAVLKEAIINDGSLENGIVSLKVTNGEFDATLAKQDVTITGLPDGFVYSINRVDATTLQVIFTGKAAQHAKSNSVANILITVNKGKVTRAQNDVVSPKVGIDFIDQAYLTVTGGKVLYESSTNDGSISSGNIKVKINNGQFANDLTIGDITVENLPAGLTLALTGVNAEEVYFNIVGNAVNHSAGNTVNNISITVSSSKIKGSSSNIKTDNITINFIDAYPARLVLPSDLNLVESTANDGSMTSGVIKMSIVNGTFKNGANKSNVTLNNLPAGMDYTVVQNSTTEIVVTLTGRAINHRIENNAILFIGVSSSLLEGGIASLLTSTNISFRNPLSVMTGYWLSETDANDGAIVSPFIKYTLVNGWFIGNITKADVIMPNLPTGMDFTITQISSTELQITITGKATKNDAKDSLSNLTISVLEAKVMGAVGDVTVSDITMSFRD